MSEEKSGFNLSIGGDVSGDVAQTIDKSENRTTNIAGDMHGDVNQNQGVGENLWVDVDTEVAALENEEVQAAVDELKVLSEKEDAEPSEYATIIETLKPYKPLGLALLKAVALTPAGPFLTPAIEAMTA